MKARTINGAYIIFHIQYIPHTLYTTYIIYHIYYIPHTLCTTYITYHIHYIPHTLYATYIIYHIHYIPHTLYTTYIIFHIPKHHLHVLNVTYTMSPLVRTCVYIRRYTHIGAPSRNVLYEHAMAYVIYRANASCPTRMPHIHINTKLEYICNVTHTYGQGTRYMVPGESRK